MLSEKAKGKQRAVESAVAVTPPEEPKKIIIRFTEGVPDLALHVGEHDTIRDMKCNVCLQITLHSHRTELIQHCRYEPSGHNSTIADCA